MKDLFKRFNIDVDLTSAQKIFINKINNYLFYYTEFADEKIFTLALCNNLGIKYLPGSVIKTYLPSENSDFQKYLLYLQVIIDMSFYESIRKNDDEYTFLISTINSTIEESPMDLGIKLKKHKSKSAQIQISGSKLLDEKLVDDVLSILSDPKSKPIKIAFEKGLKEFLESSSKPEKIKNVVRDMQLACDETCKLLLGNKDQGFKHLFLKDNGEKLGLNKHQMQIFWNLNDYIDKNAKHKSDAKISREDAEFVIYLTGMFIRLMFTKNNKLIN